MFFTGVIIIAIMSRWDLSHHLWFWITIAIIVGSHVPLVLFIRWPQESYPGFTLWLPVVLDYAVIYGLIKVVEKVMKSKTSDGSEI